MRRIMMVGMSAAAATLLILLAGCDGDAATPEAETSLEVEATEYAFTPDEWTIQADTDVSVTLVNEGRIEHEWAVLTEGTEIGSEAEFSEDLVETEIEAIPAGESATATVNLPAGTYQVICALPGHFDQGMEGTLTVE